MTVFKAVLEAKNHKIFFVAQPYGTGFHLLQAYITCIKRESIYYKQTKLQEI